MNKQPLWEDSLALPQRLNVALPCDSSVPLLGIRKRRGLSDCQSLDVLSSGVAVIFRLLAPPR